MASSETDFLFSLQYKLICYGLATPSESRYTFQPDSVAYRDLLTFSFRTRSVGIASTGLGRHYTASLL